LIKKIIYSLLTFFILLIVAIVVAANSSYVIKKVVDIFAPDYKISYDDITGNVFTGVNIAGLKFDNKEITKNIKFSWNPSKILYKRVAIHEISGEDLDVETVKALIASFPKSVEDENKTSSPLPVVINVDKIHLTVKPFEEQGILIEKTLLDVSDVSYAADEISVDKLFLKVDTNVTDLVLYASLDDGKVTIEELGVENIDSETLEKMFASKNGDTAEVKEDTEKASMTDTAEKTEEMNPLIPKEVLLKKFMATLKPRSYKTASIDKLMLTVSNADADVEKILSNKKSAVSVQKYGLDFQSDLGQIDIAGSLKNNVVTIDHIDVSKVDTLALQALFVSDNNESNVSEEKSEVATVTNDENQSTQKVKNNLIPEKVIVKKIHTDILPSEYDPLNILTFALDANDIVFDVEKLVVEKGDIDFDGKTNLTNFSYQSKIKNNTLLGDILLTPNDELFTLYKLPVRREAIGNIKIDLNASEEKVLVSLHAKAKQLLVVPQNTNDTENNSTDENASDENASKPFNLDIDDLTMKVVYLIKEKKLKANTNIAITTPYAKDISVTNTFLMDGNMSYSGDIKADKIVGLDAKLVKPLNNFHIAYKGDLKSVITDISAEGLKGSFVSKDFKKGLFKLETSKGLSVSQFVQLPPELNATKVNVFVNVPLDFMKMDNIKGKAKITSNVANVDADIFYGKNIKAKITTTIPKDSLLINFDKNVHYAAISPLVTNVEMGKKDIKVKLSSSKINADIMLQPDTKTIDGKINIAGMSATLDAKPNGDIAITSDVGSFASLLTTVQQFYTVENLPKVEGKLDLSVLIKKNQDITLNLSSPHIIYHADRKTDHDIDNVKFVLGKKGKAISLNAYQLTYNGMKIFATKPSIVKMDKGDITISELWLNDQLKVTGQLDTKKMKGTILADAPTFTLAHEMIDLDAGINIKTVLDGNKTNIDGKVTLLGGEIHYDLDTKTFPSDSDIVIVQEMKKEEANLFMDNLTIAVNVDTKKPLVFKQGPINVQSKVNMGIHKAIYSDPMVVGSVDLVDGGSYVFQGKRFVLENSHVYFTGDPGKPMLDITVKHRTIKNTIITINITGTPAVPNILFSSVPSLSKEQILSIILFDSEGGAGTNSGDDMMKMMGGAMAKSALSNLGVKLDHLVIGEGNSVEVGKKISDKVTVIYINGDIPEMKVKYDYNPTIEGVIGASERSESADIVYKKDFSADDIIIMGR